MIKTVLFDLDGTLIQTPTIILETFKELFEEHISHVQLTDDLLSTFLGQPLFVTFGNYVDQDKVDELVVIYRNVSEDKIAQGLSSYPGAIDLMKHLQKKKINIGVVTSKLKTVAIRHLTLVGLMEYIEGVIGYEDVLKHKPDPEPIEKGLALFDAKPQETVYIGDHENDIKSAKKVGVMTCAVSYSLRFKELLYENPDYVIDELSQIKDII